MRKKFTTDIGLSIVGFAGPAGAKIGTIYYALSNTKKTITKKACLSGTRDHIRKKASNLLIELLYQYAREA